MKEIQAKLEVLGEILHNIYTDINTSECSNKKKILKNVCTQIYKIQESLHKQKRDIEEEDRPKKLETLIILLKEIDASDLPENYDTILKNDIIEKNACETLIDFDGTCLWDNHDILGEAGFSVFAGERDRFGWLTGFIQTTKGVIQYG